MPTFFARRYVRPISAVGVTERLLSGVIVLATAGLLVWLGYHVATDNTPLFDVEPQAYGEHTAIQNGAGAALGIFADINLPGWNPPATVQHYAPDELYRKINGRDETYIQHGVVELVFTRYDHADDPARAIDVYYYDMDTPANAAAVFKAEAPPKTTSLNIGDESYAAGGAVFFRQAAAYIQLLPYNPDDAQAARELARRLAESDQRR